MWNICNLLYFSIFYQNVSQSQQIFAMVTGSLAVEQCQRQFLASDPVAALSMVRIGVTTPWLYRYACTSTSGTCTFVHGPLLCRLLLSPFSITFIPQTRSLQFARRVILCMYIYFLACEDSPLHASFAWFLALWISWVLWADFSASSFWESPCRYLHSVLDSSTSSAPANV